ncbi:hypothetical protein DE146DRAFT_645176 [Phaeosphaeria sp. MPI-PUGE-AT-0046c]|nr:hypothetical protein DE146DRAFT_645176 [Phaeosphaeria sp. MPI-PUGE-AT-0046c]
MLSLNYIFIASLIYPITIAQNSLVPSNCIGKITSFPNCDAATANQNRCNSIPATDKNAIIKCICTQSYINSWVGCKSETRQCGLTTSFDSVFDSVLVEWHKACDVYLSAPITTPTVAQPTATVQQGVCGDLAESCNRWSRGASTCRASNSNGPVVTSCLCSKSMLNLASACEIDGSRLCLFSRADVTQLWEYQHCPGGSTLFANAQTTTGSGTIGTSRLGTATLLLPASTSFAPPIFGQATTTPGRTTTSSSGAQPTAEAMVLGSSLFGMIALLQRMPLDAIRMVL